MVSVAAPSRRPVSRASRVDELRARGCAMDDPPYCGGFACCRDVTPSVFPHMTFLLDGVNLTIAGDAYVLLASVGYGGRVDGDAVRRLKEAFDMPFIIIFRATYQRFLADRRHWRHWQDQHCLADRRHVAPY